MAAPSSRGRSNVLDPHAGAVWLACGAEERYAQFGKPLVLDALAGAGPLAGLVASLEALETEWLVALACDMPRVRPGLLDALLRAAVRDGLDVCLPRGERGVEPLCGVYRRTCAPAARAALDRGERRMISFWRDGEFGLLKVGTLAIDLGDWGDPGVNLNTPGDWEHERRTTNDR